MTRGGAEINLEVQVCLCSTAQADHAHYVSLRIEGLGVRLQPRRLIEWR